MRKYVRLMAGMLLVCMLCGLAACNTPDTPEQQPTESEQELTTETPTDQTQTETETETETESKTETETEGLQIEITPSSPTSAKLITFYENSANATLLSGKSHVYELVFDGEDSVIKLTTDGEKVRDPNLTLDYATYMQLLSLEPVAWDDCAYLVLTLKTENVSANAIEVSLVGTLDGSNYKARSSGTYNRMSKDWQTVILPFSKTGREGAVLSEIRIDFADTQKAGETVYIKSVAIASSQAEVLEITGGNMYNPVNTTLIIQGLTKEYKFLQVTDLHASAFSAEEAKAMDANRRNYITARRGAFTDGFMLAEERMPYMFGYADEIGADMLLLTGDIIDFPSELNMSMMYENITALKTPTLFTLGNHDWCYADDYLTPNAAATYIPAFNKMSVGQPADDPYVRYVEYDEFMIVAVDNSADYVTASTVDKFLALCEKGKPIILMLHVPLHVDSLVEDSTSVWGKDLGMGGDTGFCAWNPDVQRFYAAVAEDENSPVVAVLAGHVHFTHEDTLPNGVVQYITSTAYTGDCRVITVKGE
ncbi:MAG: metallophosphoesterase [Ruminococcaceae bacterium]|nr:metallophosphoesterase [Oscillospiraceae bacterium]